MALVNGKSDSPSLDLMARFVHVACFALHAAPYFKYVQSNANWADEISREGLTGNWARDNAFTLSSCTFAPQLLEIPCVALARVFEFL